MYNLKNVVFVDIFFSSSNNKREIRVLTATQYQIECRSKVFKKTKIQKKRKTSNFYENL